MRITIGGMGGVGRVGSVGRMGSYGRGVDSYDKRKRYNVKLVLGPKIESLEKNLEQKTLSDQTFASAVARVTKNIDPSSNQNFSLVVILKPLFQ